MLDRHTITRMLTLGTKAGICDYKPVNCVDLAKKKIKLINTETNEEKQFDYLNEMIEYMHSIGLNIDRHTVKCYADGWYWSYYKGIKKKVPITTTYHGYKFEYI